MWRATVPKEKLAALQARLTVVSTRLRYGELVVHVHADTRPDETFEPVEPELEDAYFWAIRQYERAHGGPAQSATAGARA